MATTKDDDFSTGFGGWDATVGATASNPTDPDDAGGKALLIDTTAAAAACYLREDNLPDATSQVVGFYLRVAAAPGATQFVLQCSNAQGNLGVGLTTGRVIRAYVGAANSGASGVTLALDTRYWISAKFDATADPARTTLQVNGANEITITEAGTVANMTDMRLGSNSATTAKYYYTHFKSTDNLADYPLAEPVVAADPIYPYANAGYYP